jgi:hypothetical protein
LNRQAYRKDGGKGPAIAETIQKIFMVEYGETIKEDDMEPQIQESMLRL